MLMTCAYLYICAFDKWKQRRSEAMQNSRLISVLLDYVRLSSINVRKLVQSESLDSAARSSYLKSVEPCCPCFLSHHVTKVNVLLETSDHRIHSIQPTIKLPLDGWKYYAANEKPRTNCRDFLFVVFEMLKLDCNDRVNPLQRTKLKNFVNLIAWKSGQPFHVVAECSENNFTKLVQSFIENKLVTDETLQIRSITSVDVDDEIIFKLRSQTSSVYSHSNEKSISSSSLHQSENDSSSASAKIELALNNDGKEDALERVCREELTETYSDNECAAGEAPAEPLEEMAPEMLTPIARKSTLHGKPPNVLIYCGKKDSSRLFKSVLSIISQCINTDRYTIYHLKHDQVKTLPWLDNTVLLIISSEKVYDGVDDVFLRFFLSGGTVVSFTSLFDAKILNRIEVNSNQSLLTLCYRQSTDCAVICGRYVYNRNPVSLLYDVSLTTVATEKQNGSPVIVEAVHESSNGVALLSQVNLEKDATEMAINKDIFTRLKQSNSSRFEILRNLFIRLGIDCEQPCLPPLTPLLLLTNHQTNKRMFLDSVASRLKEGKLISKDVTLEFITRGHLRDLDKLSVTNINIPLIVDSNELSVLTEFNYSTYELNLKTKILGNVMLYANVISTTMNLFEGLMFSVPSEVGLVAIARRQTAGQGRGGNVWLSPPGCAMFSIHVRVPILSLLGGKISFLQHLMSLAIVLAVRQKPGYEAIDLRIKWPNDIYFGANMKIGGILVKSSVMHDVIHANIGCGVNVTNKDPTLCINDLIEFANKSFSRDDDSRKLELMTIEELIGLSITKLEELITRFQSYGSKEFKDLYCRYWLHTNQMIRLTSLDGPEARVVGLDDFGYLLVKRLDGQTESVQPDGNSFDMMKNLISPKTS